MQNVDTGGGFAVDNPSTALRAVPLPKPAV
jgi:hypothetical protein